MVELIRYVVSYLVEYPDQIEITEVDDGTMVHIQLKVAESDTGKVIGRQGRIAKAIRTVIKAAATKESKKVIVEIL